MVTPGPRGGGSPPRRRARATIRVLAIDGGGIRGLIPATVLAAIERRTARRTAELFDLIAGSSTGAILALGLAQPGRGGRPRYTAQALARLYSRQGPAIFSRSAWRRLATLDGIADERYPREPLARALAQMLGEAPLSACLTRVMVPTYDLEQRAPFIFKSWRGDRNGVPMREVALAAAAAPTYFEPALTAVGGAARPLIDGGVFANNPAMCAYAEAIREFPSNSRFLIVSLGTGQLTRPISHEAAAGWGRAAWLRPILDVVFDGVTDTVSYQLRQILGADYIRLQTELRGASEAMDDASAPNLAALKAEARRLLREQAAELGRLCALL